MSMKALIAEQQPTRYHLQVWLDTTRLLPDNVTPDPAYVRDYYWPLDFPAGLTVTQYRANILAETKLLAAHDLAQIAAPVTIPTIQGTTW